MPELALLGGGLLAIQQPQHRAAVLVLLRLARYGELGANLRRGPPGRLRRHIRPLMRDSAAASFTAAVLSRLLIRCSAFCCAPTSALISLASAASAVAKAAWAPP